MVMVNFKNMVIMSVFCPGLKKGMVLLEEKGHFCSRNYILRALSRAKLFYEGTLHKLWATHPILNHLNKSHSHSSALNDITPSTTITMKGS